LQELPEQEQLLVEQDLLEPQEIAI